MRPSATIDDTSTHAPRNEVQLVGRLAVEAVSRELPSGDVLVTFRLIVTREPAPVSDERRTPTVDTLDCAAWTKGLRRTVCSWSAGDVVAVEGAVRRRFWRTPGGPASRYEIEVRSARRLERAA